MNTENKDRHKILGDRSTHLVSSDRELKGQSQTRTTPTTLSQSTSAGSSSPARSLSHQSLEEQLLKGSSPLSAISSHNRPFEKQFMEVDPPIDVQHTPRPRPIAPTPPNQMRRKMTLSEYRASKGLAPNPHQQRRSAPNLFIQRSRPSKVL